MIGFFKKQFGKKDNRRNSFDKTLSDFNRTRNHQDTFALCHAPFKSMRFEPKGIVRSCCYNVEVVLGRYPEMNLLEIWNSDDANSLRDRIKQNDLRGGCRLCEKQLENKEFETVKLLQYDNLLESKNRFPVVLDFSLHNTCNLECTMCHGEYSSSIRKNRERLPPVPMVYNEAFVDQLDAFIVNAKQFVFAGGEPFLIDIHYKIWERINVLNPDAESHIVTNGTILNERVKKILEGSNYHITLSIDSFQEDTYESIRINASFKRVMEHMRYFQAYCKKQGTRFCVNVCPIKANRFEIPEMVTFCNENDIRMYLLNVVYPPSASLQSMNAEEIKNTLEAYSKFQMNPRSDIEEQNARQFNDLVNRLSGWLTTAVNENNRPLDLNDEDGVNFNVIADELLEKALDFCAGRDDTREQDVREKIEILKLRFHESQVPKGRLKELESISSERIYGMLAGLTEEDLMLVVQNHYL